MTGLFHAKTHCTYLMSPYGPVEYCVGLPIPFWKQCSCICWDVTLAGVYYVQITPGFTSAVSSLEVFTPSSWNHESSGRSCVWSTWHCVGIVRCFHWHWQKHFGLDTVNLCLLCSEKKQISAFTDLKEHKLFYTW